MDVRLSDAEKVFIIHGAEDGLRADGRGPLDYRPVILECAVLTATNGSARVQLGSNDLLIGVKVEMLTVDDMNTYRNRINFYVDCSVNASLLFAGQGGDEFAAELASALDSAYDNDYVLPDLKRLLISHMHAWKVYVDIVILQCDGSVIDAAAIGVKAALRNTEISNVLTRPGDEGKVIVDLPDDNTTWKMDVSKVPLVVSVNRLGSAKIVDNSLPEEACTRATLWIAVAPQPCSPDQVKINEDDCLITFVRQRGGGSLEVDSLEEMISIGVKMATRVHSALNERFRECDKKVEDSLLTFLR